MEELKEDTDKHLNEIKKMIQHKKEHFDKEVKILGKNKQIFLE